MCGRYSLTTPMEAVREVFGFLERPNLPARANIAPSQNVAAVRLNESDNARHFVWLRWGLVPAWAKDPAIGNRMINARAESVAEKPAFRAAFRRRRCLIVADGFYEWKSEGGGRWPYRIARRDGAPFAFAGLWERWEGSAPADDARSLSGPIESCTIITTDANATLRPIHPRMPVMLDPDAFGRWLDPDAAPETLQALLRAYPGEALTAYQVSRRINAPANDDPALVEPITDPEHGDGQPQLF